MGERLVLELDPVAVREATNQALQERRYQRCGNARCAEPLPNPILLGTRSLGPCLTRTSMEGSGFP